MLYRPLESKAPPRFFARLVTACGRLLATVFKEHADAAYLDSLTERELAVNPSNAMAFSQEPSRVFFGKVLDEVLSEYRRATRIRERQIARHIPDNLHLRSARVIQIDPT